jgi:tetraacyldisaccharide 4'-kinase
LNPLSAIYGQVTRLRRRWYERRPQLRRQLGIPVVSVGNLVVGGTGKTPVVATVAGLLRAAGYAPAVVSRGYKRRHDGRAVVIVSDGSSLKAGVAASGDEPQLLARQLPGVSVVVGTNRYDAGVVARDRLGANVLILDDGFQHLRVARTVDLLLLSERDLAEPVLPVGRLREPVEAARFADALLVPAETPDPARLTRVAGVARAFGVRVVYRPLQLLPYGEPVARPPRRVIVLAAIARPERFITSVRELGYSVEGQITFRDHHWFSAADLHRVQALARRTGADAILTTEKDAMRLADTPTGPVPIMSLPIAARIEPVEAFRSWLIDRIGPPQVRR